MQYFVYIQQVWIKVFDINHLTKKVIWTIFISIFLGVIIYMLSKLMFDYQKHFYYQQLFYCDLCASNKHMKNQFQCL